MLKVWRVRNWVWSVPSLTSFLFPIQTQGQNVGRRGNKKKTSSEIVAMIFFKKTFQRLLKNCRVKVTRTILSSSTITITITITNTTITSTVTTIILTTTAIIMITTTCYSFDLAKVAVKTSRKGSRSREKNAKVGWAESSELVIWFLGSGGFGGGGIIGGYLCQNGGRKAPFKPCGGKKWFGWAASAFSGAKCRTAFRYGLFPLFTASLVVCDCKILSKFFTFYKSH